MQVGWYIKFYRALLSKRWDQHWAARLISSAGGQTRRKKWKAFLFSPRFDTLQPSTRDSLPSTDERKYIRVWERVMFVNNTGLKSDGLWNTRKGRNQY